MRHEPPLSRVVASHTSAKRRWHSEAFLGQPIVALDESQGTLLGRGDGWRAIDDEGGNDGGDESVENAHNEEASLRHGVLCECGADNLPLPPQGTLHAF